MADSSAKHAVWNSLHDGYIEGLRGVVPGKVTFTIGIEYLCEKLPTAAHQLTVDLIRCTRLDYLRSDGESISDMTEIRALVQDADRLSAEGRDGVIFGWSDNGALRLVYDCAEIILAEGITISQEMFEEAARRYWDEWSQLEN